jgi:hypothetical protein
LNILVFVLALGFVMLAPRRGIRVKLFAQVAAQLAIAAVVGWIPSLPPAM